MIQRLCNLIRTNNLSPVPEAVDVWIHYSEQNTSVLLKVRAVGSGTAVFSFSLYFLWLQSNK